MGLKKVFGRSPSPLPIAAEPRPQEVPSVTSPLREMTVIFVGADGCPPGNFAHKRKSWKITTGCDNRSEALMNVSCVFLQASADKCLNPGHHE